MAWETKPDFEFTAKGSEIKNVPRSETDIKRLYFYTEDTPKGQVTIKPIKDKETEERLIPKTIPEAVHYTVDTLPENVVKAMQKANKMDEVTIVCTVTRAQDQGEEPNFFIRNENMKTLEVESFQDESGEV